MSTRVLEGRRIILAVTGSIAAVKATQLLRLLMDAGAEVRVVMTESAQQFIMPLTFQTLSGHPVYHTLDDDLSGSAMDHIALARWADMLLIAPASANVIAKCAWGLADDLLSTLVLASKAQLLMAPAMNQQMYAHAATQHNVELLRQRGVTFLGPDFGTQACGDVGLGRLMEPQAILQQLFELEPKHSLKGVSVLINAGPTQEPIDPVRYISNHSSGRMGYALAEAAVRAGAQVTLVSGPTQLPKPQGMTVIPVITAQDMHDATLQLVGSHQIFIATAAVTDFRVEHPAGQKLKKEDGSFHFDCILNDDILHEIGHFAQRPFTVGFAAETERLEEHALRKLHNKNIDMIAANLVGKPGSGFGSDHNALAVYWARGHIELPLMKKDRLAVQLIDLIVQQYQEHLSITPSDLNAIEAA